MTKRQWSLVIVLLLVNYIIFSQLFQRIMNAAPPVTEVATATRVPTFTPSPVVTAPIVDLPTATPVPVDPTATNTPVLMTDDQRQAMDATQTAQAAPPAEPTATPPPQDTRPRVTASTGTVNLRSGPGTNYGKIGALPQGQSLDIVGRNEDSSWWQVSTVNGLAWIAASVTVAENADAAIPVVSAPPPPPPPAPPTPAAPPTPTPAPQPQFQYTVSNLFAADSDNPNAGLTRIKGVVADSGGNGVNGISLRVQVGSFCAISTPTHDDGGPGRYDFVLDTRAREGTWNVDVVGPLDNWANANANKDLCRSLPALSETKPVVTTLDKSIVTLEWRKNW